MMKLLIRKNTYNLRENLERLGYTKWNCLPEDLGIVTDEFNFKFQSSELPNTPELIFTGLIDLEDLGDYTDYGYLDCGENEDLFLALAALEGKTDLGCWFILFPGSPNKNWILCKTEKFVEPTRICRKATSSEIIEYYESKN